MRVSVPLLATVSATVQARTDIASQLYSNSAITTPPPPSRLNSALQELVGTVANFTTFPANVQRALLWSAGWVRAISDSTSSTEYVQVYVLCDRTMADVFQSAQAFKAPPRCEIKECKSTLISFTKSTCDADYVQSKALCAVSRDAPASRLHPLQPKAGPFWSMDGQIDDTFDPQLFQVAPVATNASHAMFLLAQKSAWSMQDDTCPNRAQFIAPCKQVDALEVDVDAQQRTWCEPEIELGVKLWVAQVYAAMNSHAPVAARSPPLAMIVGGLFGLIVTASIVAIVVWRRSQTLPKDGLQDTDNTTFFIHPPGSHPHRLQRDALRESPRSSDAKSPSFDNAMQREALNESFRSRAPALAAFCDNQELMLKRIAFASIIYHENISRGSSGEVWRGEYEGQPVAIKCTGTAAIATSKPTDRLGRTASTLVNDSDLKRLVDFTIEIQLAASLEHPNIVHFLGLSWRMLSDLCMVSEYVALGNLAHVLAQPESKSLSWKEDKLAIAADISNALVYFHSLSPVVLHRDLTSWNVLLTPEFHAKLSNFGLGRDTNLTDLMPAALLWTAPEVLRGDESSEKADIYSFGVLLAELDTCLPPYASSKKKQARDWVPLIATNQASPPFRADCPRALRHLARQCLDPDPSKRPRAMEITYMLRSKIPLTL